jgi:hypothetical protein
MRSKLGRVLINPTDVRFGLLCYSGRIPAGVQTAANADKVRCSERRHWHSSKQFVKLALVWISPRRDPCAMPRKEIIDRIEKYVDPFRVTKGEDFKLTDFDPGVSSAAAWREPNNHKSQTLGSAASIEEGLRQGDPDVRVVSKAGPSFVLFQTSGQRESNKPRPVWKRTGVCAKLEGKR